MKQVLILMLSAVILMACDKVKQPEQNAIVASTCTLNTPVVKTNTATSGFRKILIEDYTGHRCGFCPPAARKLETLEAQFKDSLVAIAVHAGTQFAPPTLDYPEDFRTIAGTDWDNFFGCSAIGLPKGLVNRTMPYVQGFSAWTTLANANLHKPQSAKLDIITYFDLNANLLNVDVKTTFKTAQTNDVWLCIVITEDSIRANQTIYAPVSTSCIFEVDIDSCYHFNSTLRASVNSSWGGLLKAAPIAINDTISKKYSCYKVSNVIDTKNINLVAFVYNYVSKEVLQVEKIKLR